MEKDEWQGREGKEGGRFLHFIPLNLVKICQSASVPINSRITQNKSNAASKQRFQIFKDSYFVLFMSSFPQAEDPYSFKCSSCDEALTFVGYFWNIHFLFPFPTSPDFQVGLHDFLPAPRVEDKARATISISWPQ